MSKATSKFILFCGILLPPIVIYGTAPGWIRISFTGDIIMHGPVQSSAFRNNRIDPATGDSLNNRGFDHLFEGVRSLLKESDLAVGNMEFPVSPPFASRGMTFNCRPEVLPALKKAGISLVSIANNHILDQGMQGLCATMRYLEQSGLAFVGAHKKEGRAKPGRVIEVRGIRIGFLACTDTVNHPEYLGMDGNAVNRCGDSGALYGAISEIRENSDFVVLLSHFGAEYVSRPSEREMKLARTYCGRGVDLVIGHHPHVLQPMELYTAKDGRVCHIFYSLGNFISNQTWDNLPQVKNHSNAGTQDSAIVECYIRKKGHKAEVKFVIVPVFTSNRHDKRYGEKYFRDIRPLVIRDEVLRLERECGISCAAEISELKKKILDIKETLFGGKSYSGVALAE